MPHLSTLLHSCTPKLLLFRSILSRIPKTFMFFLKKWSKNLEGACKVHTFASAFEQNAVRRTSGAEKKEFFERITQKTEEVVQERRPDLGSGGEGKATVKKDG